MDEFMGGVDAVLTVVNVTTALIGGLLAGYLIVGRVAADPAWVSPVATPRGVGGLVAIYSVVIGALFYLGQTVAAWADGDAGWPRIASRFVVWVLFALVMGVGVYVRLRRHELKRHGEAVARAIKELSR